MDEEGGVRNWLSTHLGFRSKENTGHAINREHLDNGMGLWNFIIIYEVYLTNKSGEMTVGNFFIIYEVYQTNKSGEETVYIPSRMLGDKVTISMEEVGRYEMLWGHGTWRRNIEREVQGLQRGSEDPQALTWVEICWERRKDPHWQAGWAGRHHLWKQLKLKKRRRNHHYR